MTVDEMRDPNPSSGNDAHSPADGAAHGVTTSDSVPRVKHPRGRLIAAGSVLVALAVVLTVVIAHSSAPKSQPLPVKALTQAQLLQAALLKSGTLTWGSDTTLGPPAAFVDPAHPQAITGLDADVIAALAQRLHLQTQFAPVAWAQFPQSLRSRDIDLFADGVVTADVPANDATFSSPYLIMATTIVVRAGDTRFTDLKSLEGYPVGVVTGDRGAALAQTDARLQAQSYDQVLPFEALASGRIDAIVVSSSLAQWYGARDSLKRFTVLAQEYNPAPVALALAVNGPHAHDLNAIISDTLHTMAQDGTLAQILQRWGMTDALQQCITAPAKAQGCPTH